MNSDIVASTPDQLRNEIPFCICLIKEGDAVNPESAAAELPHAPVIAIKRDGREIVGIGAIKQKRPYYAVGIVKKSGFKFDTGCHELGYVSVKTTHRRRGIARQITEKLVAAFPLRPIFATTSSEGMKVVLKDAGFELKGAEWQGSNGKLSLWIKY